MPVVEPSNDQCGRLLGRVSVISGFLIVDLSTLAPRSTASQLLINANAVALLSCRQTTEQSKTSSTQSWQGVWGERSIAQAPSLSYSKLSSLLMARKTFVDRLCDSRLAFVLPYSLHEAIGVVSALQGVSISRFLRVSVTHELHRLYSDPRSHPAIRDAIAKSGEVAIPQEVGR